MTIPSYFPRANPVERTLKTMIVAFIEELHHRWDEHLHELVFAYNTAKHSSIVLGITYVRQPGWRPCTPKLSHWSDKVPLCERRMWPC